MHGEKIFLCSDCDKQFGSVKYCENHIKSQKFSCKDGTRLVGPNTTARVIEKYLSQKDDSNFQNPVENPEINASSDQIGQKSPNELEQQRNETQEDTNSMNYHYQ